VIADEVKVALELEAVLGATSVMLRNGIAAAARPAISQSVRSTLTEGSILFIHAGAEICNHTFRRWSPKSNLKSRSISLFPIESTLTPTF